MPIRKTPPSSQAAGRQPASRSDPKVRPAAAPPAETPAIQPAEPTKAAQAIPATADELGLDDSQQQRQLADAVGAEVHNAPVDGNTPITLRLRMLQSADELSVDARATERLLRRAHDGLNENQDPELAFVHNRSSVEGTVPSGSVETKLDIDENSKGATVLEERASGVRGTLDEGNLEAAASLDRTTLGDDHVTTTRVSGRAGMGGVHGKLSHVQDLDAGGGHETRGSLSFDGHRTSVQAEHLQTSAEQPDVAHGVGGKLDVHRLGFTADLQGRKRTADGANQYAGGNVTMDPTGVSVSATHGRESADGHAVGQSGGVKLESDMVGLTLGRQTGTRSTSTTSEHTAKLVDVMLGDRKASIAYMAGSTGSAVDFGGSLHQDSKFMRAAARVEAFREVEDLGPTKSDDPLLAGRHRVEIHQKVDGAGDLFLGRLTDGLGLFGGLKLQKGKEILYRTHLKPAQAEALARRDESVDVIDRAKRKVVGHGLRTNSGELPDLSRPNRLKIHDEVLVHTTGAIDLTLGVMAYGLRAGAQVRFAGDFSLRVKKTSTHEVEVEVMPTKVRGVQGRAGLLPAEVGAGLLKATAFVQRFRFDLSTKSGRTAYNGAIQGVLPGTLTAKDADSTKDGLELVHSADLPAGVTRTRVEKLDVKETNRTGRVGWMLLSSSVTRSERTTEHVATDGQVGVNLSSRTIERKRNTLLTGNEHAGATGAIRRVTDYDPSGRKKTTFDALTLSAHYTDDKVKKSELNDDIVDDLNDAFGLKLPRATLPGSKGSRAVVAQVRLEPSDLRRLSAVTPKQLERAARGDDKLRAKLDAFQRAIAKTDDPLVAAKAVQDLVVRSGSRGVGAVVELAGVQDALELTTRASDYDVPLKDAAKLLSRYAGQPWSAGSSKEDLTARYRATRQTQEKLAVGIERLDDDPFLAHAPEQREAMRDKLIERHAALDGLVDLSTLSHEDAVTVHSKLERGWTTGRQRAFQAELVAATGLSVQNAGLGSTRATSSRDDDAGTTRTRSVAEQRWLPLFGDAHTQVSIATRYARDKDGVRSVAGMRLKATVEDEASRGKAVNDSVARINRAFATQFSGLGRGDDVGGARRSLLVERDLSAFELESLGKLNAADVEVATARAASPRRLRQLGHELSGARDVWDLAHVVEAHVAKHGLQGMGDVHLLAADDRVSLSATTDAYSSTVEEASQVIKRWSEPLTADARTKDVAARFSAVSQAREQVRAAIKVLGADSLTATEVRYAERKQLRAVEDALEGCLSLAHLEHGDAAQLAARLQRGWRSGAKGDALARLELDCGLDKVTSTSAGVLAHALRPIDDLGGAREVTSLERAASWLRSGEERVLVAAERVNTDHAPLELSVELTDSAEHGDDLNRRVVGPLNKFFGTNFRPAALGGDGSARTVVVRAQIDDDGLLALLKTDARAHSELLGRAGLKPRDLARLQQALGDAGDPVARGSAAGAFVGRHGLGGVGVLHQLAGDPTSLAVSSRSAGVDAALQHAAHVMRTFGETPLRGDMNKNELVHCLRELDEAGARLDRALAAVDDGPLIDDDSRTHLRGSIVSRRKALAKARSFDTLTPNAREALAARLDTGWTSARQRRVVEELRADAAG